MQQSSLFDQTAENRARNRTILWWVLNLAHEELSDDKQEQVFKGSTHGEKLAEYDRFEEEDEDIPHWIVITGEDNGILTVNNPIDDDSSKSSYS